MTERVGLAKADFVAKQDNINPPIRATLRDANGDVIILTGSTVRFHMKSDTDGTTKVDAPANIILPATAGRVEYEWIAGDLDTAGWYSIEWEVMNPVTEPTSVPNFGYDKVLITAKIA